MAMDTGQALPRGIALYPHQLSDMFREHREKCLTTDQARVLDEAYKILFIASSGPIGNIAFFIDHPYTPYLAKKLG